jgi:hypothetical protein
MNKYPVLFEPIATGCSAHGPALPEWPVSDTKRRVKFYSLTKAGRKQLASQAADWKRLSGAISEIVFAEG